MSDQKHPKRRYEKRRRAEAEEATRRRITEAAVELHGTIGPARTSFSALAKRAGVQRATVYRHFPDQTAVLQACSAHWALEHPVPDPAPWAAIADPAERLRTALAELYGFYRGAEPMLANVIRDAEVMPEVRALAQGRLEYMGAIEEILAAGWEGEARRRAAIALALDFGAWRLLAKDRGLPDEDVVEIMAAAVI